MTAPAVLLAFLAAAQAPAPPPERTYYVFVASEGVDRIQLVSFGPAGASVERSFRIGTVPTEAAGPHGLGVAPDGRSYFVSTGHGMPFGSLWKYASDTDRPEGRVELGPFPASLQASPDGHFVYVVNFNLHGEMVPSSVSVVAADEMVEVARIPTCTMPHGSRLTPDGTRHYSACMMDDLLVEIDTRTLAVARRLPLGPAHERRAAGGHAGVVCSPTWAQPSPDGRRVYVACNKANEILEIDAGAWVVRRRFQAGDGVYNLATTRDGRLLIASNKRGQSVSVFDAASGKELKRLGTRRKVVHGVAVSPDDRYAFVSVEGVGAEPGTVEMIDLRSLATVATVDVGPMAGGIDVWKVD
ncbi:MAG: YncE family protein [Gemmatimonadales bacterium]